MSFIRFNNAEGGTSGTTVSAANSGGASGYSFDVVWAAWPSYSNAVAQSGSLSLACTNTAAGNGFSWNVWGTPPPRMWSRMWFQYTSTLPNGYFLQQNVNMSPLHVARAGFTGGKLTAFNGIGGVTQGSYTGYTSNTWYRLEMCVDWTTQTVTAFIYDNAGNQLDTVVTASGGFGASLWYNSPGSYTITFGTGGAFTGTFYMDNCAVSDQGWIGNAVGNAIGPFSKSNNGAGVANGTLVNSANSGGSAGDAFDIGASNFMYYSWMFPRPGGQPLSILGTSSGQYCGWNAPGTSPDIYTRCYFLCQPGTNNGTQTIATLASGSLTVYSGVQQLTLSGLTGIALARGAATLVAGTWYRFEIHWHADVLGAGYVEAYVYSLAGIQVDYVKTPMTAAVPPMIYTRWGSLTSNISDMAMSDQGWIGPAADIPSVTSRKGSAFLDVMG